MGTPVKLSDRMTGYQQVSEGNLMRKQPVIIRLDGRAFKTFTSNLIKPFDEDLSEIFQFVCFKLKEKIQGTKFIYQQSDEISLFLCDYDKITTDSWFDYRIQKMASISASLTTTLFNRGIEKIIQKYENMLTENPETDLPILYRINLWKTKLNCAMFDSRVFNIPNDEICNYFIWRQQDAIRNSKQSMGQAFFSHNQLQNKNVDEVCEMLIKEKNVDWYKTSITQQRGFCICRDLVESSDGNDELVWKLDTDIPIFKDDRTYIERNCASTGEGINVWKTIL